MSGFLVGVAICYQEEHVDDALTLFHCMMDRDGDGNVSAQDVIRCVQVIEEDVCTFNGDMQQFCKEVFGADDVSDDKSMHFNQFAETVKLGKQTNIVQTFLQFIVFSFFGLEFDEKMMVVVR